MVSSKPICNFEFTDPPSAVSKRIVPLLVTVAYCTISNLVMVASVLPIRSVAFVFIVKEALLEKPPFKVIDFAAAFVPLGITTTLPLEIVTGLVCVGTPLGVQLQGFVQSVLTEPLNVMISVEVAT